MLGQLIVDFNQEVLLNEAYAPVCDYTVYSILFGIPSIKILIDKTKINLRLWLQYVSSGRVSPVSARKKITFTLRLLPSRELSKF